MRNRRIISISRFALTSSSSSNLPGKHRRKNSSSCKKNVSPLALNKHSRRAARECVNYSFPVMNVAQCRRRALQHYDPKPVLMFCLLSQPNRIKGGSHCRLNCLYINNDSERRSGSHSLPVSYSWAKWLKSSERGCCANAMLSRWKVWLSKRINVREEMREKSEARGGRSPSADVGFRAKKKVFSCCCITSLITRRDSQRRKKNEKEKATQALQAISKFRFSISQRALRRR